MGAEGRAPGSERTGIRNGTACTGIGRGWQTLEKVKQQKFSVEEVAHIEAKPLPPTSKVMMKREDYDKLVSAAQKYVVQEQKEGELRKLLIEAKATIAALSEKLAATTKELVSLKSVMGGLRTAKQSRNKPSMVQRKEYHNGTVCLLFQYGHRLR